MVKINKIYLQNFKKFRNYTLEANEGVNVFIGDNEAGKSTILQAIDLVICGNINRIETIGIDKLLNTQAVEDFLKSENKQFCDLPKVIVELYLSGDLDWFANGKNNIEHSMCDGIRLICEPNLDYYAEIMELVSSQNACFPYDYYTARFSTFADEVYSSYKKILHSTFIDNTRINTEYALNDFVKDMYRRNIKSEGEATIHRSTYRSMKNEFVATQLKELNDRICSQDKLSFGLKNGRAVRFENELMIYDSNVSIDERGMGQQVFIKTDFALRRANDNVDVVLFEEPENHLSTTNLKRLVEKIANFSNGQVFLSTHNSFICSRLDLRNLIVLHDGNHNQPVTLKDLTEETSKYFLKAPAIGIAEFALAQKAVLVEGPSEYMLFEVFYKTIAGVKPEEDGVAIISLRGLSFKRYLEVAILTGVKVAVVTDNDGDMRKNCVERYKVYDKNDRIGIFYEDDDSYSTFEKVFYKDNQVLCDKLFPNIAINFMLSNKTEAAYILLNSGCELSVPEYIRRAIIWIRG